MKNGMMKSSCGLPLDAAILSTSQKFLEGRMPQLGDTIEFDDGRKFRYVSSVIALAAGQVVGYATANATQLTGSCTAAAIGAYTVTIDTTTVQFFGGAAGVLAADRLAGGYLAITGDAGVGYLYRIKSHTAGTASASITFTLWDALKVALTTASDVHFVGPKFRRVVEGTATLAPVGVVMVAVTGTDEYYFWVQTKGPAVVSGTGTVGVDVQLAASGAVTIAVETAVVPRVGVALATGADEMLPVDLKIE